MPDVLVTGFEPFAGQSLNSSGEVVRALDARGGMTIATAVLPVEYRRSLSAIREAIVQADPRAVISLGQADGRHEICVETVATRAGGSDPDEAGLASNQPGEGLAGPVRYRSTLPVTKIVESLARAGIPAILSQDAGTYVCNHLFYGLMHLLVTERPATTGGFVHLPLLPEHAMTVGAGVMSLSKLVEAVGLIIEDVCSELPATG
jgi:pyroglutamyl-peptidase